MAAMAPILDFWSEHLRFFLSASHPDTSYQVLNQLATIAAIFDFWSKQFMLFSTYKLL